MATVGPGVPWWILGKPEYLPSRAKGTFPLAEVKAELPLKGELIFAFCVSGKAGHMILSSLFPSVPTSVAREGATRQSPQRSGQTGLVICSEAWDLPTPCTQPGPWGHLELHTSPGRLSLLYGPKWPETPKLHPGGHFSTDQGQ